MAVEAISLDLFGEATALAKVILIDVVLAGDNAIVVAMAAAGVAEALRTRVIFYGIGIAVGLRIIFALIATKMLALIGLTLAGGLLLLWVAWKLYREIRTNSGATGAAMPDGTPAPTSARREKSLGQAIFQLIVADVSMSLDNVLAVAGAANDHLVALVIGLVLSIGLMGTAASLIARYLHRWRWLTVVGLLVIIFVALDMIWRGINQVACSGLMPDMCRHGDWALQLVVVVV
jgi:YjbE family integral membrane protein